MNRRVLLTDIKEVTVVEEENETLKENEVRVAIKAAGICGSDLHYYRHGGLGSHKQKLPMQIGHEPAGEVIESNSSQFKVGDRVAIEPSHPDLDDKWSLNGRHNLASGTFMGANASGCMADEVVVHETQCVSIPDDMSYPAASLLEPVAVGFHAINRSNVTYQDTVTIFGCGPVGLCLLLCLKKIGVTNIYCVDPLQHRRDAALKLGASAAYDPTSHLHPPKCSVVFDVCGTNSSFDLCVKTCDTGSKLVIIGIPETDSLEINPHILRTREVDLINIRRSDRTLHDSLKLFENDSSELDFLVTHEYPLSKCQKAFRVACDYDDGVIKAVLNPSKE
jgi:L-iditol 2-dehydrogenase|tara:strand:+ start:9350 stop:10354 length:1005 start_codon:yes stop_codon:yes gene_type:complete